MRTSARMTGVAAAAAAAALLVSGCSSSGEGGSDSPSESSSQAPHDGGGEHKVDSAALQGGWATSLKGDFAKDVLIMAVAKDRAVLTGKAKCSGSIATSDSPVTLDLTCQDGDDYSKGTVKHADDKKLTVEWSSGETTDFMKATDEQGNAKDLPADLPTDLPTDMPTDLPTDAAELPE